MGHPGRARKASGTSGHDVNDRLLGACQFGHHSGAGLSRACAQPLGTAASLIPAAGSSDLRLRACTATGRYDPTQQRVKRRHGATAGLPAGSAELALSDPPARSTAERLSGGCVVCRSQRPRRRSCRFSSEATAIPVGRGPAQPGNVTVTAAVTNIPWPIGCVPLLQLGRSESTRPVLEPSNVADRDRLHVTSTVQRENHSVRSAGQQLATADRA
jgi:hypothetical protein